MIGSCGCHQAMICVALDFGLRSVGVAHMTSITLLCSFSCGMLKITAEIKILLIFQPWKLHLSFIYSL